MGSEHHTKRARARKAVGGPPATSAACTKGVDVRGRASPQEEAGTRVRLRRALAPPCVYPLTCTKGETSGAAPARPETRRPVARPLRPLNMSELEILTLSASARGQGGER